jgi:uridine kinase
MFEKDRKGIEELNKLNAWRRQQSTLSFIMYAAIRRLFPKNYLVIEHSVSLGFYCRLNNILNDHDVVRIETEMKRIIKSDLKIIKTTRTIPQAIRIFRKERRPDILELLASLRAGSLPVYELLGLNDTFGMPPLATTGLAARFYLKKFSMGFIIVFPRWQDLTLLPEYVPQYRLAKIFDEYTEWSHILGLSTVGELNMTIRSGAGPEIVKVSEALHEKKIIFIADRISRERRKVILIAGPSSAGKTTFTKRLAVQLLVNGLRPIIVSTDNYFLPHSRTPLDEFGRLDFEGIKAVDIPRLNRDLLKLIAGKRVLMPRFNFLTGRRCCGEALRLPENGVALVEGIHCLNEELTFRIERAIKFKIYISALTQLNIDDHNRVSTTDTRLMRRIVRDTYYRGYEVTGVLRHWGSVKSGEEKNIYPYQEEADEMFNSALVFEPSILKKFCVPILKKIRRQMPEYEEARRLLSFFALFNPVEERDVPSNSILREFIGGSSFVY